MTLRISDALTLPDDAVTETFALLAKRGAGKSNAAVVMAEAMFDAGLPWVAIDPKGDWWGIRSSGDGKGPGLPVLVLGGQHADVPLEPAAGRLVANLIVEQRLTAVLDVSMMSKSDMRRFLADFAERLYQRNTEPLHVFAEEAHEYIPQRVDAGAARMVGAWEKLVKWGRTHGLGVTLITQRSASLNKDVLTQVETLIALRTTGPQDQAAIRAWVDEHDNGAAMMAELRKLPSGDAFVLSPQWLELDEPKRITFARRRTFDSGATPRAGQKRTTPRTLADVDLAAIKEAMAETIEKAAADDPKTLRARIRDLERQVAEKPAPEVERVEIPMLDDAMRSEIASATGSLVGASMSFRALADRLDAAMNIQTPTMQAASTRVEAVQRGSSAPRRPRQSLGDSTTPGAATEGKTRQGRPETRPDAPAGHLRAGARRMVESLGRMAPLHLTTSQWGMVAHLKTTGGTWSTYLNELKRAGLVQQHTAGWQLTDAGFDYLGGRPAPMTATELQEHYRTILRAGAVKMLDALIDAYPDVLSRDALGERAQLSTAGGTFSTYLNELIRNGLAERDGTDVRATDILMNGASA